MGSAAQSTGVSPVDRDGAGAASREADRHAVTRRGRRLQYLTLAWNLAECAVALAAGFLSGSVALVGFGFDSAIEVSASAVALWRLARDADAPGRLAAEQRAQRLIGVCFLLLAGYVTYEAVTALVTARLPEATAVGVVLATLSLVVMPLLARAKRRVAGRLGSGALEAESRQTVICAYLSAVLLLGLGLNAWLGWWWADPLAGVLMAPLIASEGAQWLRGRACCAAEITLGPCPTP